MTAITIEDMPAAPDAYHGSFYLQDIEPIGHFSRIGPDGQHIAFDDSRMRYCRFPVDGKEHQRAAQPPGLVLARPFEGFEQYAPHQDTGNRTDALCEWAVAMSAASRTPSENGPRKSLYKVTMGSKVTTDRTTLMKIASTPYANHRYGWKLDAFRFGDTLVICPHAIETEQQHFNEKGGLKGVYRLEMLKNVITTNKNGDEEKISAANSYSRVMTANLTDGTYGLKLIYAMKVDCVNRESENPIEIRTLGKRLRPKDMLDKMLNRHILSRLSASHQLIIGVHRADDKLESIKVLPTDFMREFAEHNDAWKAQTCFSFLYEVIARMRNVLVDEPEGQRLTASYSPKTPAVHFDVHEMGDPQQLFVSLKFWEQFAANAVA